MKEPTFTSSPGDPLDGLLVYSDSEHSFRFEVGMPVQLSDRSGDRGRTSLSIGTLQIEADVESGVCLFVWGLHPRGRWVTGSVRPVAVEAGIVRIRRESGLKRGVSIAIADVGVWTTLHDPDSGWIRVTDDLRQNDDEQFLIATGTVIGLRSSRLSSVSLFPIYESGDGQ